MSKPKMLLHVLVLTLVCQAQGASLLERSYEYVKSLSLAYAPALVEVASCVSEQDVWECAKEKAGKMLDLWQNQVNEERRSWAEAADAEVAATPAARTVADKPSRIGGELEGSLRALSELLQNSFARAMARKKGGGGVSISLTPTSGHEKEKKKKKKKKPIAVQIAPHHMMMMMKKRKETGRSLDEERGPVQSWRIGSEEQSALLFRRGTEEGEDKNETLQAEERGREIGEERGKKKKKKKAILKLLLLGAVAKAKIGLLLQILSAKLQVKFFLIALAGLAINLARFWLDLKKGGQPQKVIYYEHAQHQHHYEHDEDDSWGGGGGGYWSRSIDEPQEEEHVYPALLTTHEQDEPPRSGPYRGYPLPPRAVRPGDRLGI